MHSSSLVAFQTFIKNLNDDSSKKLSGKLSITQLLYIASLFDFIATLRGDGSHLSRLVGSHEEGVPPQALRKTPAAATVRRLTARVADHSAAPQIVLVVHTAGAVSSLQEATQ